MHVYYTCVHLPSTVYAHENRDMENTTYGDWLKQQRKLRRLTQAELERRADVGHSHMSKIENGHIVLPEPETRGRIHAVLGTSDDDLVSVGVLERTVGIDGGFIYDLPAAGVPMPGTDVETLRLLLESGDITEDEAGELVSYLNARRIMKRERLK